MKDLRIVFMGTPEFAVTSLTALVEEGCNVVAVVTAPDKPAGRGLALQQSAVKTYGLDKNIPVLQPEKLRSKKFLRELKSLEADLQVVVAFRMLPELVWAMPPMGTVNLHGSLLPQYRGAAPINWAVINGEEETGVTTFKLQHEIDTGPVLLQERIPILPEDDAGSLHDKMKETGAQLLVKTVKQLAEGSIQEVPQQFEGEIKHAPKIFTETCEINFDQQVEKIHNLVRGLSPYPAAFTFLKGKKLKIFKACMFLEKPLHSPGEVFTDGKNFLRFAAQDGYLEVLSLQLEGKKKMDTTDFLKGYRFA